SVRASPRFSPAGEPGCNAGCEPVMALPSEFDDGASVPRGFGHVLNQDLNLRSDREHFTLAPLLFAQLLFLQHCFGQHTQTHEIPDVRETAAYRASDVLT